MEFITNPWYVINRGWERIVADDKWVINTDNKEAIEVLTYLFKEEVKEEEKETLPPKTTQWKSQVKK